MGMLSCVLPQISIPPKYFTCVKYIEMDIAGKVGGMAIHKENK